MDKVNLITAENTGRIDVAQALGSTDLLMFVYDLDPGEGSSPYHYEYDEEWLLVVEGMVVVRTPDGEQTLERGDLVRFPAGPEGAHKVMNRSDARARTLLFSRRGTAMRSASIRTATRSACGRETRTSTSSCAAQLCRGRTAKKAGTRPTEGRPASVSPVPEEYELEVAGRTVAVTSPDKVFFPERGETKLDLVRYYQAVEEPLHARRCRAGRCSCSASPTARAGTSFFQKRVPESAPEWLQTDDRQHPERHHLATRSSLPTWPTWSGR